MKKKVYLLFIIVAVIIFPAICLSQEVKPVAYFTFQKTSYQQNEPIEVRDESYSPGGEKIVRREWMAVINGKKKTSTNIKNLLNDVKAGEIEVFLRVKDGKGSWSEWVSKKIKITEPKAFQITAFKSSKASYAVGEKLQLTYTYNNPNDLEIKSQRWRYRNITTNGSNISGKPTHFKKAGVYEITLELQDEWGNWSNKVSVRVNITEEVIQRNGYYLFEKGSQGDLIEGYIDKDYNTFSEISSIEVKDVPGTLLMSNSPESLYSSGILYRDTVSGTGRLLLHHQNRTQYSKKLLVLVTAPEDKDITLKISKSAIKGPGRHILPTGQDAVLQYLEGGKSQTYTIKAGETLCLYDSSKIKGWRTDEVISGTLDFESNGSLTWQVAAMDELSGLENLSKLNILSRDVHNRGTFNVIERQYVLDLRNITEPVKLVLGREQEEWLQGRDALTGDTMWNKGNYGLPVKISIKNNTDMGVIINARGGSFLGAVRWKRSTVFTVPNEDILSNREVAALVGLIKTNEDNEIVYMLPNGSSAPVLFGFIPKAVWR